MHAVAVLLIFSVVALEDAANEIFERYNHKAPSYFIGINGKDFQYLSENEKSLQLILNAVIERYGGKDVASLFQNMTPFIQMLNITLAPKNVHDAELKLPKTMAPCLLTIIKMITDIMKKPNEAISSPLIRMIDATGKLPSGVLGGNFIWTGNYRECIDTPEAHHCINQIKVQYTPLIMHGSCVPKQCTAENVAVIFKVLSAPLCKFLSNTLKVPVKAEIVACNEEEFTFSSGASISIGIMGVILFFCLLGTIVEALFETKEICQNASTSEVIANSHSLDISEGKETPSDTNEESSVDTRSHSIAPIVINDSEAKPIKSNGILFIKIATSFSLLKNTSAIFSTDVPQGAITSINGIRFISMSWVILGHYYAFAVFGAKPDNYFDTLKVGNRFSFLPVANAFLSVDSFFLLSGLLVSYLALRKIAKGNRLGFKDIMMMYVHRYIRLTPSVVIVILIFTNIFPLTFTGPFGTFYRTQALNSNQCFDYWWTNLLYINNFYPDSMREECINWTWYLANDMQFYILSPGILLLMVYIEKKFKSWRPTLSVFGLIGLMCLISMAITGTITGYFDIPSLKAAQGFAGNPRGKNAGMEADRIYTKPYTRITPYLVGMFLGYLFNRNHVTLKSKYGRLISATGWAIASVLALLVVYGPWKVFKDGSLLPFGPPGAFLSTGENIMYGACHRFVWSCAVAWVIFACHNRYGGVVDKILSWKAWIPLSRLTYSAYNVHLMVLYYLLLSRETQLHYQDDLAVSGFISCVVISYAAAFILTVCVEYPVLNLEKIMFKR